MSDDRYGRQRLIEWWDQERLRAARVMVAGVGALGNEVLKNLVLLGVGRVVLVDFDRIEPSNLSRMVLFDERDIGRSKVEVAAERLRALNPDVEVVGLHGDLFYDVGLGYYRHSELVIGCLDNLAARSQVGGCCVLAGKPYLDGGMWSLGGEVRWFMAGEGPCFDCTMEATDWARADDRRSCSGFRDPAWDAQGRQPTVITTAAIIGGMLAQEAAKWLCGHAVRAGRAIVYNGQSLRMHQAELMRNPSCPTSHAPYDEVIELPYRASEVNARQLLARAQRDLGVRPSSELLLELGREFLLALHCPTCGEREAINQLWGQVLETERLCKSCGSLRQPETIRTLDEGSPLADHPLSELGVPPAEVLAIHSEEALKLYELTGDVA